MWLINSHYVTANHWPSSSAQFLSPVNSNSPLRFQLKCHFLKKTFSRPPGYIFTTLLFPFLAHIAVGNTHSCNYLINICSVLSSMRAESKSMVPTSETLIDAQHHAWYPPGLSIDVSDDCCSGGLTLELFRWKKYYSSGLLRLQLLIKKCFIVSDLYLSI